MKGFPLDRKCTCFWKLFAKVQGFGDELGGRQVAFPKMCPMVDGFGAVSGE